MKDLQYENVFSRVYRHDYTIDAKFRIGDENWQEAEDKYEVLIDAWQRMVNDEANQFGHSETDFENYPREILESPYSTVSPYHQFLKHEEDQPQTYDQGKNGYKDEMFRHLLGKLPNLGNAFESMFDKYRPILDEAKEVPEQPEDLEEGKAKPEPYYKLD